MTIYFSAVPIHVWLCGDSIMGLKQKIMIGAALLAVLPVLVTGLVVIPVLTNASHEALEVSAEQRLVAARNLTKGPIEDYFWTIRHQVLTLSNNRMIRDAVLHSRTVLAAIPRILVTRSRPVYGYSLQAIIPTNFQANIEGVIKTKASMLVNGYSNWMRSRWLCNIDLSKTILIHWGKTPVG